MTNWTVDVVLNRALTMEKESFRLYNWAIERVSNPEAKTTLKELALEEKKHIDNISKALRNEDWISEIGSDLREVEDLKIVDWLDEVSLSKDATYQELLIFAGKREKEAYDYYQNLGVRLGDSDVGKLFLRLALEELKHKNRIEKEYDRHILQEM